MQKNDPTQINLNHSKCESALNAIANASGWDAQQVSWLQSQLALHAKRCRKLQRYSDSGLRAKAAQLQGGILRSFPARLAGELCEYCFGKGATNPPKPIGWKDFEIRINRSPLNGKRPDPVRIYAIKKANGKTRYLASPGKFTRAAGHPLVDVLEAKGIANPYEHNCSGRGPNVAIAEICKWMTEEECEFLVVFDLANFYSSVRPKNLKWLNLPREVMEHVVFYTRDAVHIRKHQHVNHLSIGDKASPARRGIPQGATVSGKIASALLGRELRDLSGATGIVTYGDDGVIGARTQPEAEEIAIALQERFANLPGGPIGFKLISVRRAREGIPFLGYWIRLSGHDEEAKVWVRPSHQAKQKFRRNLFKRFRKVGPSLDWDEAMSILEKYRTSWLRAFPLWQPGEFEMSEFEGETEIWISDFFNGFTKKIQPLLKGFVFGAKQKP